MFLTCQIPLGLATTFPSTAPVLTPFFIVGKNSRQIVAAPDRTISYGKTRLRLARALPKGLRSVFFEIDSRAGCREAVARGATQHPATRQPVAWGEPPRRTPTKSGTPQTQ